MPNANAHDIRPNQRPEQELEQGEDQKKETHILHTVPSGREDSVEGTPSTPPEAAAASAPTTESNVHPLRESGTGSARGTAAMDPVTRQEVARKGGLAVSKNKQHMADIGRKGGQSVSKNREHMAKIGRKGGAASRGTRGGTGEGSNQT